MNSTKEEAYLRSLRPDSAVVINGVKWSAAVLAVTDWLQQPGMTLDKIRLWAAPLVERAITEAILQQALMESRAVHEN